MNRHLLISTLAAVLACRTALADEQRTEVVKSETGNGEARAEAHAFSSTTTTNRNGKRVTIIEDQDENGKKRLRMITYDTGKPKVKDITPREKQPAPKEDPFWKKNAAGDTNKPASAAK